MIQSLFLQTILFLFVDGHAIMNENAFVSSSAFSSNQLLEDSLVFLSKPSVNLLADVPTAKTLNLMLLVFIIIASLLIIFLVVRLLILMAKKIKLINENIKDSEDFSFFSSFFTKHRNLDKPQFIDEIDEKNDFEELEKIEKTIEINVGQFIKHETEKEKLEDDFNKINELNSQADSDKTKEVDIKDLFENEGLDDKTKEVDIEDFFEKDVEIKKPETKKIDKEARLPKKSTKLSKKENSHFEKLDKKARNKAKNKSNSKTNSSRKTDIKLDRKIDAKLDVKINSNNKKDKINPNTKLSSDPSQRTIEINIDELDFDEL